MSKSTTFRALLDPKNPIPKATSDREAANRIKFAEMLAPPPNASSSASTLSTGSEPSSSTSTLLTGSETSLPASTLSTGSKTSLPASVSSTGSETAGVPLPLPGPPPTPPNSASTTTREEGRSTTITNLAGNTSASFRPSLLPLSSSIVKSSSPISPYNPAETSESKQETRSYETRGEQEFAATPFNTSQVNAPVTSYNAPVTPYKGLASSEEPGDSGRDTFNPPPLSGSDIAIITKIVKNFTDTIYPALLTKGPLPQEAQEAITQLCLRPTEAVFVPYTPKDIYNIEDSLHLPIDFAIYLPISKVYRGPDKNINKIGIRIQYLLKRLVIPNTVLLTKISEKQRGESKKMTLRPNKLYINSSDDVIQAIDYAINIPTTDPAATRITDNSLKSTFIQSLYDLYQTYTLLVTQYTTYDKLTTDVQSNTNKLANTIINNYLVTNGNGPIYTKTAAADAPNTVPTIKQRHYVALGLLNTVIKNATLAYLQFIKDRRQDVADRMERIIAYLTHELRSFTTLVTTPETILVMSGGAETPKRKTLRRSKRVHKIEKDSSE